MRSPAKVPLNRSIFSLLISLVPQKREALARWSVDATNSRCKIVKALAAGFSGSMKASDSVSPVSWLAYQMAMPNQIIAMAMIK